MRSALAPPTSGPGLAVPEPSSTVATNPTRGLLRAAASSFRVHPGGSSGRFVDKLQPQHAQASKGAFKFKDSADPSSEPRSGTDGHLLPHRIHPIKESFKFSSWQMVKPAHWWRKQASFRPQPKQGSSSGSHSRQPREAATLWQKQRKFLKGVTCYRCRANGHYSSECRDPIK
ncbi:hypothetical protein D1007_25458 [Hordeum vulgare]|nr:hypothetical protein D1007_25458 [Hordeum vulgare]